MAGFTEPADGEHSPCGNYWYDREAASYAVEFFAAFLHHIKNSEAALAGDPFVLQPWQEHRVIRPLFGWKRARDGTRRYRTAFVFLPRKNGKSTLASGVALLLLAADHEPGAEVYSAAGDRKQAGIVFDMAAKIVQGSEELYSRVTVRRNQLLYPQLDASYTALSADAYTKHGLNAHGIIFDEMHVQPNRELYEVLHTSMGSRSQPVEFIISTAGSDQYSVCYELYDYASKVESGELDDPEFLPVLYGVTREDLEKEPECWMREETWARANPNLGVSVRLDYLRAECERAKSMPAYENTFKRLFLNIWTEQSVRWMPMHYWDASPQAPVDEEVLRGMRVFGALDLSAVRDLTAAVFVGHRPCAAGEQPRVFVFCRFWLPEENLKERIRYDRVPYDRWAREGWLTLTPGNVVDHDRVREEVRHVGDAFALREVAIDRWNAAQITTQLTADGLTVVPFGQGFASMSEPMKEVERLVLAGLLDHGGNPVLRWCVQNTAAVTDDAMNIKPSKDKSTGRIDGLVALVMAVGRLICDDGASASFTSIYETRGLRRATTIEQRSQA